MLVLSFASSMFLLLSLLVIVAYSIRNRVFTFFNTGLLYFCLSTRSSRNHLFIVVLLFDYYWLFKLSKAFLELSELFDNEFF